jgi:hypothetical protein
VAHLEGDLHDGGDDKRDERREPRGMHRELGAALIEADDEVLDEDRRVQR